MWGMESPDTRRHHFSSIWLPENIFVGILFILTLGSISPTIANSASEVVSIDADTAISHLLTNDSSDEVADIDTANSSSLYKVLRVIPENGSQLLFLDHMEKSDTDMKLNFWTSPVNVGSAVDVMVSLENLAATRKKLESEGLTPNVIIEDVEKLIIQRERKNKQFSEFDRRYFDDLNEPHYDFHHYGAYTQMVAYMKSLARKHPKIARFISIGKTHEGRSIDGLEIGTRGPRKRVFWIDGGIHAREWAAPHTALYFIHQLTSKYGRDPNITRYVNELTWVITPSLNPDGYTFTR
jgi:hypothetical protein